MDQSASRSRKRRPLAGAALALLLCAANAAAQRDGPPPSANEAHAFLADTFGRYSMGYVVWHGRGIRDNRQGRAGFYGGRDCISEIGTSRGGNAFAVDWSKVSSVDSSGADGIYVMGQLMRPVAQAGRPQANFHIYAPSPAVSKRVMSAFDVLRSACVRRTLFD